MEAVYFLGGRLSKLALLHPSRPERTVVTDIKPAHGKTRNYSRMRDKALQREDGMHKVEGQERPIVRLLKNLQVRKMIPMSHGRLYSLMDKNSPYYSPDFPTPIRLAGGRSVYWIESEIVAWIERNINLSRGASSEKGGV